MSGTCLLLGSDRTPHETFIQVGHGNALPIPAQALVEAIERSPTLRQELLRYVQTFLIQMGQCAAADARYSMEARLARWLLMCHDRTDDDGIPLTHEFMGIMIASHRSGVTASLHILEGTGAIRSTRGIVIIRDRQRLEELAGDSYGKPEAEYRRLIGPFGLLPEARNGGSGGRWLA